MKVGIAVSLWLLCLYFIVFFLPQSKYFDYSYEKDIMSNDGPTPLWHLSNFDGAHYQNISRYGYFTKFQTAFFPLYPLATHLLTFITTNYLFSGLLISLTSTLFTTFLIYRLYPSPKVLLAFLCFPTSFFLLTNYTESLFLCLALLSWAFSKRRHYYLAGLIGFLAALSRFYGVLLFPAILLDFVLHLPQKQRQKFSAYSSALPLLLIPIGLLIYMYFLNQRFDDPLSFIHSLSLWNKANVTFPLRTIYRYLHIFATASPITFVFQIAILEFISLLAGLFFVVILYVRRLYPESLFVFLGTIIPTFTGTLQSLPRYLLVLFPIYFLATLISTKRLILLLIPTFLIQIYLLINFLSGHFVA